MSHSNSHLAFFALFVVFVFASFTTAASPRSPVDREGGEQTDCDFIRRISHVCYQCSKRHEEDFNTIYTSCCSGRESGVSIREYCEAIYTEPPKRGGLWM